MRAIQEAPPNLARSSASQHAAADASAGFAAAPRGGGALGSGSARLGSAGGQGCVMTLQDGLAQLSRFKAGLEAL